VAAGYATPMVPPAKVVVRTDNCGGGLVTAMLSIFETVVLVESCTCTVKVDVPIVVGVPAMTPVLAANVNPAGRVPVVIDQV
jgi:hypothetical protein